MKKYILLILVLVYVYDVHEGRACPPPNNDYATWLSEFSDTAIKFGVTPQIIKKVQQLEYKESIALLKQTQPEFQLQPWEYLDRVLSPERINQGQTLLKEYEQDLTDLRLGVAHEYLIAIWGLETNYGTFMGEHNIIQALTTLSSIGHRTTLTCRELILALYMLEQGKLNWEHLQGSWSGAIGHTQFLPSSLLFFGQDVNGDGIVSIWDDPLESLASTASYLLQHNWITDLEWGFEVSVPEGLDWYNVITEKRPFEEWKKLGILRRDGKNTPHLNTKYFRFLAPAGHLGALFLVSENFDTLLRYNNSIYYALSVGLLANIIKTNQNIHLSLSWPRQEQSLSLDERLELQNLLTQAGYDVQGIDGIIGRATRQAIRKYQHDHGMIADGFASNDLLEHLRR